MPDTVNLSVGPSRSSPSIGRGRAARLRARPRRSRAVPVHARRAADDVPRPALDDAPVRRLRHGGGDERAASDICSPPARPDCASRSICRRRWASTPTRRARSAKSAASASRSTRVEDMHVLLDGIPLDKVSTSMTINATASTLLAMYIVVAEERGIARDKLSGTIQNDILKEYIARGTYIYPPEPSLALDRRHLSLLRGARCRTGIRSRFPATTFARPERRRCRSWRSRSRTRSSTCTRAIDAGLAVDAFAPRLSFFFAAHNDLFEEVAKFRAARRIYARIMRERFGANDASARLRFHTQTGGVTLQAQQPLNNVVRVTVQALVRGAGRHAVAAHERLRRGARAADAKRRRSRFARSRSSRNESGAALTADPLAGSYYVEHLTDELERRAHGAARDGRRARRRGEGDRRGVLPGRDRAQRVRVPAARRERRDGHRRRQQVRRRSSAAGDPDAGLFRARARAGRARARGSSRARCRARRGARSPRCASRSRTYATRACDRGRR